MPSKKYKYNEIDFEKQLKDYYAVKDKISEHIFPLDDEKLRAAVKEQMPDKWEEYKNFDWDILAFLLYEHYIYKWFYDEFNPFVLDEFIVLQDELTAKEKGDKKPLHPHKVSWWYKTHPDHKIPDYFAEWWEEEKVFYKNYKFVALADDKKIDDELPKVVKNIGAETTQILINNMEYKTAIRKRVNKKHIVKFNKNLKNIILLEMNNGQVEQLAGKTLTREKHESVVNAAFTYWINDDGSNTEIAIPYNKFAEQMGANKKYLKQSKNRKKIHKFIDDAILDIMNAVFSCKADEQLIANPTIENIKKVHFVEFYTEPRLYNGQWTECIILHKNQPFFKWCINRTQIVTIPKRLFNRLECFGGKAGENVTMARNRLIQELYRFMHAKTTGNTINITTLAENAGLPIGKNAARDLTKYEKDIELILTEWKEKNILFRDFGYIDFKISNRKLHLYRK